MTEDEAKTKMCCGPPSVAASNYYRAGADCDAPMHCIGSACMAWRWTLNRDPSTQEIVKTHGYCGLAGEQP